MARLVYFSTHGQGDPVRAALPFILALGAIEAGEEATVCLAGGAVALMKDHIAKSVRPPHWPTLEELIATAVNGGVVISVLPYFEEETRVEETDLDGKHASFTTAQAFAIACAGAANVITV